MQAIHLAKQAGFDNFNLDIMYGLPHQTIEEALGDIRDALTFEPTHFSWYQLTIEPNTAFYRQRPPLPSDDLIWEMQLAGQQLLKDTGFKQYEVSAYSQSEKECLHNRNYWEFGDYLGIGAGAHSKITQHESGIVQRFSQVKHPKDYLESAKRQQLNPTSIQENDLIFEFMLNGLRLTEGIAFHLFEKRTGLALSAIEPTLDKARERKLISDHPTHILPTPLGRKFLNDLITLFLPY